MSSTFSFLSNKKNKLLFLSFCFVLVFLISAFAIFKSSTKLTYLEYEYENSVGNDIVVLNKGDHMEQHFIAPYDIISGISLKIGTYQRDNNSNYNICIISGDNNKTIYSEDFNASLIDDNTYYPILFDKGVKVQKGVDYIVRISSYDAEINTCLAFYKNSEISDSEFSVNNENQSGILCFAIYGGDFDFWWIGFVLVITFLVCFALLRAYVLIKNDKKLFEDRVLLSFGAFFLVVLLLSSFSVRVGWLDELDNMRGGIVISDGGVLYRDYVTQHTPIMYYLCGLFAKLGADSVGQFRLSYYMFVAMIWGLLFYRHSKLLGIKRFYLFIIFECMLTATIAGIQGYMVLSEGVQGICLVALLLEFVSYIKKPDISWSRSIVISLSVWGAIGVAFISVYSISIVFIVFVVIEISKIIKNKNCIKKSLIRYCPLFICSVIPPLIGIIYFKINKSLYIAYNQAYLFNREVYSRYQSTGKNIFLPYVSSIKNYFALIADTFNNVINAKASFDDMLKVFVIISAFAIVVRALYKKKYGSIVPLLAMIFSCPRDFSFHSLPVFYLAVFIVFYYGNDLLAMTKKLSLPISVFTGIIITSIFVRWTCENIQSEQQPISEFESKIISITDYGEDLYIDAYSYDSLYFLYKNRGLANRASYMLPWYMDWFEQNAIEDLDSHSPNLVIYIPDKEVWGLKYFDAAFAEDLRNNYTQLSGDSDIVWIRNDLIDKSEYVLAKSYNLISQRHG